jgi:hypothetical protein
VIILDQDRHGFKKADGDAVLGDIETRKLEIFYAKANLYHSP